MGTLSSTVQVAVIGNDLPAMIYGALAAKKGYSVVVITHDARDVVFTQGNISLVRRPQLIYGLQSSEVISETFGELTLRPEMYHRPVPYNPSAQLVMPDTRMDIVPDAKILKKELEREFPGTAKYLIQLFTEQLEEGIKGLKDELLEASLHSGESGGLFSKLKVRSVDPEVVYEHLANVINTMEKVEGDTKTKKALLAIGSAMGLIPVPWHPFAMSKLLWNLRNGLVRLDWGLDAMQEIFQEKIKSYAGEVEKSTVIRLGLGGFLNSTLKTIDLDGGESIGFELLVLGQNPKALANLFPQEKKKIKGFIEQINNREPSHYLFTINLILSSDDIPEGMANIVFVVQNLSKPLEGDNLLILHRNPAMAPQDSIEIGKEVMSITAFLPASMFDGTDESLRSFAKKMIFGVHTTIFPFLDPLKVPFSIPAVFQHGKEKVIDLLSLYPLYTNYMDKTLNTFSVPIQTKLGNVLNLSYEVCGALGFEGAFFAAKEALRITQGKIKLKDTR